MDLIKIGQLIAELRKEKNLTQDELGEKFHVNGKAVSKWERGRSIPDISILVDIADYFNLSVDDLLKGKRKVNNCNLNKFQRFLLWIKKYFVFAIIEIFIVILLIFLLLYFVFNYNQNKVFDIKSTESNFSISGKIFSTINTQYVVLDNIVYQSDNVGTIDEQLVSSFSLFLKNNDEILLNYNSPEVFDDNGNVKNYYLSDIISNISVLISELKKSDKVKKIENIYCEIIYVDSLGVEKKELVKFNIISSD